MDVKVTLRGIVTVNSITERNAQYGLQIKVQGLILRGNESSEVTLGLISCYPCEEKKIQMQFFFVFRVGFFVFLMNQSPVSKHAGSVSQT